MTQMTLSRLFETTARKDRGFHYGGGAERSYISYAELYAESLEMAAELKRLPLRRRFVAPIWMEPTPACFRAFMAVVLADGIPVPLHGFASAAETADRCLGLEAEVLLVSGRGLEALRAEGAEEKLAADGTLLLNGETGRLLGGDQELASLRAAPREARRYTPPDETAVVFLSSGSTGRPKGIMLSDRNLVSNLDAIGRSLTLTEQDAVLLTKSFGYCSTITGEWLLALDTGMNIRLEPGLLHPLQLVTAIRSSSSTFVCTVPAVAMALAKSETWKVEDLVGLRKLLVVGASMPSDMLALLQRRMPGVDIRTGYGLTEASPRVTCLPAGGLLHKPGSAGCAINGVEIAIYRERQRVLTPGQPGEVVVKGPNVMLGYYDDPERTAHALASYGLRTSDVGYLDEDGCLYLTGRLDNAFNVAGHLFHPEMLENALLTHPEVREAAVAGLPDGLTGYRPFALIVPGLMPETAAAAEQLKQRLNAFCTNKLSAPARPKDIFLAAELPRTNTGKLDRPGLQRKIKEVRDAFPYGTIGVGAGDHRSGGPARQKES
jgi:acyl-CoA synthetase (AMP-forming)/AMP-acid ligase II